MNLKRTQLHILHEKTDLSRKAKAGVSLHCHTEHSKEMMDFVPNYADRIPLISNLWQREKSKYTEREGREPDFSTAFWSPPLPSTEVYTTEKKQINDAGLEAVVSLTDHDCIDGNLKVNEETDNSFAPISLEWTVPFEDGFFHVGVHNLPKESAVELSKTLVDFSFSKNPEKRHLRDILSMLNDLPQVLIILNHPLWDIEMVGKQHHRILLDNFLNEFGMWIHAFELNGFRKWSENMAVLEIAEAMGMPTVTGGDRHGCKPNTVINLTNSKTFSEFAAEVRNDKHSEVVFMPDYKQPLLSRQLNSFSEILATYQHFPEHRRRWVDRVYYDNGNENGLAPLSIHWSESGYRLWLRAAISFLGFLGSPAMRPVFHIVRSKKDRVPKIAFNSDESNYLSDEIRTEKLSSDGVV
ncbi:MAG: hypothetical protein ACR2F2_02815 [Pyrinomonadaceae bacterium]